MHFDILRHGELQGEKSYCGVTDRKLTEQGWQQMQNACQKNNNWRKIVSSPLSRCSDFARHLSKQLNIPLHIDSRWMEINFGVWEGLSAEKIMKFNKKELFKFWDNPVMFTPTGGEPLVKLHDRVLSAWHELSRKNEPTLIITHGGPIRMIHCHYLNIALEKSVEIQVNYAELRSYQISNNAPIC